MSDGLAAGCTSAPPLFQHALRVRKVGCSRAHADAVVIDDIARAAGRRARGRKARSANMLAGVVEASSAVQLRVSDVAGGIAAMSPRTVRLLPTPAARNAASAARATGTPSKLGVSR